MSNDDDIEKLLREVEGLTTGGTPASTPQSGVEKSAAGTVERAGAGPGAGMSLVIAGVIGIAGLLLGWLPGVPGMWLGIGGFVGAYLALLIGRRFG